jgi:1,4-dihydroxy-2-naphthoate octaprenyltransferase
MALTRKNIFMAIRPHTLPASQAPILIGLALSYSIFKHLNLITALLTATVALLLQIGTNLVNDLYDAKRGVDSPERLGPTRVIQKGLLSTQEIRQLITIFFTLAALLVLPLLWQGGMVMLLLTISCFAAAFLYTGGPFPLSYYALGELLAFLFFGPIAVWGVVYLQTYSLSTTPAYYGVSVGLISAQIMSINNTRDRATDSPKGKRTIATLLNEQWAKQIPRLLLISSLIIPLLIVPQLTTAIVLLAPLPFIKSWKILWSSEVSAKYNIALASSGKYMFLHSLLFAISLLL